MLATPTWVLVVTVAGRRCECAGACGRAHAEGAGRCARGMGGGVVHRLFAAPRDPGVPAVSAWRVPVEDLAAWCATCLDAARRAAARTTAPRDVDQVAGLFEPSGRGSGR